MVAKLLSVLALATVSFAHPNYKRHTHLHHGTGGGFAMPTGATFPLSNSTTNTNGTDFGGSPVESPSVLPTATAVKTITVSPVPLESGSGADVSSASVAAAVASTTEAASAPAPAAGSPGSWPEGSGSGSDEGACSVLTSTVTSTSVQYVTVTASSADSGSEVAATSASSSSSAAFMPSGAAGGFYGAGPSSSSVAAVSTGGFGEFNGASTTLSSMSPVTSSISISATASAGEFFPNPGKGGSSAWGDSSSAWGESSSAVVPTTFATFTSSSPSSSAASVSSASSPTSSSTPSTGGGSSGGKKGLSYNTASLTNAFAGKGISWAYNWGASPDGSIVSGAEFVPMFWGPSSVSGWSSAAAAAIAGGSTHALSLNEPDLSSQSNVDPATAAKLHIANMNPLAGQVQIGSPAVTNGAGTNPLMGIDWLNAWFEACNGECKVDFVAFHWYDSASNMAYFQSHVQDVITAAKANGVSKVWLTEFGATGSDSDVANFVSQAVEFLESTDAVERYAYFMCSDGILIDGTSISSPVGAAYAA